MTSATSTTTQATMLRVEVVLVVAIAVGVSASRSVIRFIAALTAEKSLGEQTANLNTSQAPGRPWIDLGLQLVFIVSLLLPAALAIYLVLRSGDSLASIGLRTDRLGGDILVGLGAAAAVGGVGLAGYLITHALGGSLTLVPTSLPDVWWRFPVLIMAAFANATLEEVVLIGYLGSRIRKLGGSATTAVVVSALIRGCYHLYQGIWGFVGNLLMGLVFAAYFQKTGRTIPLIVAHTAIDIVAFVGYVLLAPHVGWL